MFPAVAAGPVATGGAETCAKGRIADEFFEGGGELGGVARGDEEAGEVVDDGFGDTADGVGDNGEAVGGGFEIDEAEALDAMAVVNARHGKDVGTVVDLVEFLIGEVAEEADGEAGLRGGGAQGVFVAGFSRAGADDPVFDLGAEAGTEGFERFECDELALTRVEATDREDDEAVFRCGRGRLAADDREVGAEGAGGQEGFADSLGEAFAEEVLRVAGERADAGRVADEAACVGAEDVVVGEAEDFGAVESEDEAAWAEGFEILEKHHRQHRAGLGEIDGGIAQATALGDELAGDTDLARDAVGAFDGEAVDLKWPGFLGGLPGGLGPDLDVVAEAGRGAGNFFRERGDAAAFWIELVSDQKDRIQRLPLVHVQLMESAIGGCGKQNLV